jgi:hypothetical protein
LLFIIDKKRNGKKCPLIGKWKTKFWFSIKHTIVLHSMGYDSAMKNRNNNDTRKKHEQIPKPKCSLRKRQKNIVYAPINIKF